MATLTIPARFSGPPGAGNGGFVCGVVAGLLDSPGTEVTLRRPVPVETPLEIVRDDTGVRLVAGPDVVAEGIPATVDDSPRAPVTFDEALRAGETYPGHTKHAFPRCFACGPARAEGDGLRIFTGRVTGRRIAAAAWLPHPSVCDPDGRVLTAVMHAALDCPSMWAFALVKHFDGVALLGRLSARVDRRARAGERCVVVGWPIGRDGRKLFAGTAVYGEGGELLARARATWVSLRDQASTSSESRSAVSRNARSSPASSPST